MIGVWQQMIDWASAQYGGEPVYVVGLAEDGVTGYYAGANNPNVRAISLHHLLEFGDIENVAWVNPRWLRYVQGWGLAVLERLAPWVTFNAEKAVPWEAIFSSEEDQAAYALYQQGPAARSSATTSISRATSSASASRPYRSRTAARPCS